MKIKLTFSIDDTQANCFEHDKLKRLLDTEKYVLVLRGIPDELADLYKEFGDEVKPAQEIINIVSLKLKSLFEIHGINPEEL